MYLWNKTVKILLLVTFVFERSSVFVAKDAIKEMAVEQYQKIILGLYQILLVLRTRSCGLLLI